MDTTLWLKRIDYSDNSTIGEFYFETDLECNSLEDTCRNRDKNKDGLLQANEKVYGQTAIPPGHYEVKMDWSPHFKRKMPFLFGNGVGRKMYLKPGEPELLFSDVMIHWANKPEQLLGCIALGTKELTIPDWVSSSQKAYNKFEARLLPALALGPVYLTIQGGYA